MLATRLATGLTLVAVLIAILVGDEWLAPWFPLWFVASVVVMTLCALEVVGLLAASGNRPATSTVVGGILALVAANWVPHLVAPVLGESTTPSLLPYDPSIAINVMAWPLWTFVAILMATFLSQSLSFRQPGGDDDDHRRHGAGAGLCGPPGRVHHPDALARRTVPRPDPAGLALRDGQGVGHRRLHGGANRRSDQALAHLEPEQDRGRSARRPRLRDPGRARGGRTGRSSPCTPLASTGRKRLASAWWSV